MSAGMTKKVHRKGRLHEEKSAQPPQLDGSVENVELPEYCGEAAVDIIAVHGLGSKYESTWSVKLEDGSRYHWLREKLGADIPQARILGYEYGSEWYGDPTYTNLEECGTELLRCIVRDRQHLGRPEMCPTRRKRPIIFVAHSFGGLVVKQALVIAYRTWKEGDNASSPVKEAVRRAQAANHRDFLCSTAGVIFLGTPHRGSAFSFWAKVKMSFGSLMTQPTYAELVKVLAVNSEPLNELQRDFEEACKDLTVLDILPRCYRETRQVALPPYIVVPAESAWLDHAEKGALDANHMEMNKFHPGTDANYDKVLSDIQLIFWSAHTSVSRRLEKWRYGSLIAEDDRNAIEHWLDPSRTQDHHFQSKLASHQAAPFTCKWLDQQDCFTTWKAGSGNRNVLWIHGKPASGKSVLSAYAINALRTSAETITGSTYSPCHSPLSKRACGSKLTKPTVLYFFCGVDQSHDKPQGLLGTFIHQLLTIHDTDEMMFATAYRWKETTPFTRINGATLMKLLQGLLSLVASPVYVIVDGLDDNPHGVECLQCLQAIASNGRSNTRLLILSQRQEVLRSALEQNSATISISITDYSQPDILRYIEHKTEQLLERKPTFKPKRNAIIRKLQSEVDGVFELVNTAMHDLENYVSHVDDVDDHLANLPSSLKDVYDKVFARLKQNSEDTKTRIRTALQILAVSAVPITALDLHTALKVSRSPVKDGANEGVWKSKCSRDEQASASRDLIRLLDSLVEIDDSNHFVTLVHPSLRRTLLATPSGPWDMSHSSLCPWYQFSATEAHLLVSEICVAVCGDTTLSLASAFAGARPPLVAYAWNYWAYHLRASKFTLESDTSRLALDRMLRHVHQHTLSFLFALGDFVSKPLEPVRGNYTLLEYRQSLQRAQGSCSFAIDALCRARQSIPIAAKLHEARRRVPVELSDLPLESNYRRAMKWVKSTTASLRNWLLKDQTQVARVKLDDLMEQTAIGIVFDGSTYPDHVATMLNASCSLRLVALSFSVNPLHAALVEKASSSVFSPINLLVYVAQLLEEAASFPCWHHLPEMLDPAEAFLCSTSDSEAEPAKFVIRSVDWQRPSKRLAAAGWRTRSEQLNNAPSEELGRQIRRLSEVTAHRWVAARYALDAFRSDGDRRDGWFQTLVANPLSNLHLKDKLFMLRSSNDQWPIFLSPEATLDLRAPTSLRDAPVKEIVKAFPAMLRISYVKYVTTLLEVFAEVPRAGLLAHFVQLTTSKEELLECARYAKWLCKTSLWRLRHILGVLLLYLLRGYVCPWLGAHAMVHPWADLLLSYRHPAAYLNLQSVHDAKFWFKYALTVRFYNAIGRTFVNYSQVANDSSSGNMPGLLISDTFASLYHLITLERNLFGLGFAFAVLTASAKVILYEPENLSDLGYFTFWYLVANGFGIFNLLAGALLQQSKASFFQGLPVVLFEIVVLVALVVYQTAALRIFMWILSCVLWPITAPAMMIWNLGLYLYAPFLKFCGVVLFIAFALLAVAWLDKTICDPHDLEGSRKAVARALRKIASMRDQVERIYISEFPFGGGSMPVEVIEGEEDEDSSGYDSWAWPENLLGENALPESLESSHPPHGILQVVGHVFQQDTESALGKFAAAAASEFDKAFKQVLQTVRNMELDPSRLGSLRNDYVDYDSYRDRRGNGWHIGGQRPGDPFTMLSYSYTTTGPFQRWDFVFFGGMVVLIVAVWALVIWGWWTGRLVPVDPDPQPTCWHIGIPLGLSISVTGATAFSGKSFSLPTGITFECFLCCVQYQP